MKLFALLIGMLLGIQSFACMMAPLDIVWTTPKDSSFHYSVTKEGVVSIVDAKDHQKVKWTTTLKTYDPSLDKVYVVDNGARVVRVVSNHRVNKLSDTAVDTITQDGSKKSFAASKFINALQDGGHKVKQKDGTIKIMRHSMSPTYKWMTSVTSVDAKGITLVNGLGEAKTITWN